jgi:hypothetical protein
MKRFSGAVILMVTAACGEGASLSGSLTRVVDMNYTRATLESSGSSLALRFLQPRENQEDTILKVSATLDGLVLKAGMRIDLAEAVPSGGIRGLATRTVFEDPVAISAFPRVAQGHLTLKQELAGATRVEGEFSVTFVPGAELASGRAVFGSFSAEVAP